MSMNETYQPINCDDYDSLELACMHHLILTLTLKDGEVLQAKANDLILRKKRRISACRSFRRVL
ncbi:Rho-binding antiterminator [Salmonella enterica subsp. enterica serovar Pullorum]|nr:Rho-binding antiterminator [Salmonella enterica subsp. enterica serovar Pullorum]